MKEGMEDTDTDYKSVISEIKNVSINKSEYPSGITNMTKNTQQLPLKNFCIKSSANSAYSGGYISDEMVKYVLSRGCRFLDFELYYLAVDDKPNSAHGVYVSYSNDPNNLNPQVKNTTQVRFFDILKTTFTSGFTNQSGEYSTPNPADPLFIQLRIKTDDYNITALCDEIKKIIDSVASLGNDGYIYKGDTVTKDTPIGNIMNRAVFIVDVPSNKIGNLSTYAKMYLNNQLSKTTYSGINICQNQGKRPKIVNTNRVDVKTLTAVLPDINNKPIPSNPNVYSSILNYGYQFTLFQYYKYDDKLINMENMFKQYNSGIVPMAYCLSYISNYSNEVECTNCSSA